MRQQCLCNYSHSQMGETNLRHCRFKYFLREKLSKTSSFFVAQKVLLVQYFHALGVETVLLPVVLLPQHLVPRSGRMKCTLVFVLNRLALVYTHTFTEREREHSHLPHREQTVWRELQFLCWKLCLYVVC